MSENGKNAGALPAGWQWTTIGEVATTSSGGTPSRKHPEYYGGAIPWVKSGELGDSVVKHVEEHITKEGLKNSSAKMFPSGTPLVALYGATVGKTGLLAIDAATNQAVCAILSRDEAFDAKYMIYWLQSQRDRLVDLSVGGAQPNISQGIVKAFPFPLAPLSDQHLIVAEIEKHFTRLDQAVASLKRAQANLERYKASVLKAACEGRLVPQDPDDEPADKLLQRILAERRRQWEAEEWARLVEKAQKKAAQARRKQAGRPARIRDLTEAEWQAIPEAEYKRYLPKGEKWKKKYKEPAGVDAEELPGLPEGWVWATLEQLSWDASYGTSEKCRYEAKGPPVLRIPNIVNGAIETQDLKYALDGTQLHADLTKAIAPGDLLIIRTNGSRSLIGRAAQVLERPDHPHFFASYIIRFRLLPEIANTRWVPSIWNSQQIRDWIQNTAASSAGQYNISLSALNDLPLPVAPKQLQERTVRELDRVLSFVDSTNQNVELQLRRVERLRQAVLHRAFSGRLILVGETI